MVEGRKIACRLRGYRVGDGLYKVSESAIAQKR